MQGPKSKQMFELRLFSLKTQYFIELPPDVSNEFLCTTQTTHTVWSDLISLLHIQTGQLNEYTERKEMKSDVICMGVGRVSAGEQRSRFLAVGLSDNTVRIISLDPNVSKGVPQAI